MKALNSTRNVTVKFPRDTPRISRKRLWIDRSEWRKDPQEILEGGKGSIDAAMDRARNTPNLEGTAYQDFPDLVNRTGRNAIRRF